MKLQLILGEVKKIVERWTFLQNSVIYLDEVFLGGIGHAIFLKLAGIPKSLTNTGLDDTSVFAGTADAGSRLMFYYAYLKGKLYIAW